MIVPRAREEPRGKQRNTLGVVHRIYNCNILLVFILYLFSLVLLTY